MQLPFNILFLRYAETHVYLEHIKQLLAVEGTVDVNGEQYCVNRKGTSLADSLNGESHVGNYLRNLIFFI